MQPTTLATIQLPAAATPSTEAPNAAGIMLASGISFGKQLDTALADTPTPAPSTANASTLPQASPQAAAAPSPQASTPAPALQTQPMPTTTTSAQQADPPTSSGIVTAALPQPLAATPQDVASDVTSACTSTAVRRTTSRTGSTKASADGQPQTVSAPPNAVAAPVPTAAPEQTDPAVAPTAASQASPHISGVATVTAKPDGTKALDAEGPAQSPSTPHSAPAPEAQAAPSAQPSTSPSAELALPAAVALPSQPAVPVASSAAAPAETQRSASPVMQITPALVQIGHAADGAQRLTVRLEPPELGLVQIRIDRPQEAPARVEITVEKQETLTLLLHDQPRLEHALDQAGVPAEGRSVTFHVVSTDPAQRSEPSTAPAPGVTAGGPSDDGSHGAPRNGNRPDQQQTGSPDATDRGSTTAVLPGWARGGLDITA